MKQVFHLDDAMDLNPRNVYFKGLCLFLKYQAELAQAKETRLNQDLAI